MILASRAWAEDVQYPSLYDTRLGSVGAIILGCAIIGGILYIVNRIFKEKSEYRALTQFVMNLVALVVGVFVVDMLVAGPTASLLTEQDHSAILAFVKDMCIMVLSFYFGTKAPQDEKPAPESAPSATEETAP